MRVKSVFLAGATAVGLLIAGPALAQTTGGPATIDNDSDRNILVNDLLDVFAVDNAADSYTSSSSWSLSKTSSYSSADSWSSADIAVVAKQSLNGVNTNSQMDELVDLDGEDDSGTAVGYNSGNNSVNDNAFAAFAGISNNAWNTGINNNTQAATNIAAYGTVNFGVSGGAADGGGGTGED